MANGDKLTLSGYVAKVGEPKQNKKGKTYRIVLLGCTDKEYLVAVYGDLPKDYSGRVEMKDVLVGEWNNNPTYMWYYRAPGQQWGAKKPFVADYRVVAIETAAVIFQGTGEPMKVLDAAELYLMWLSKTSTTPKEEPKNHEGVDEPAPDEEEIPF